MTVIQKYLWAPIVKLSRGNEWICYTDVRSTKRESKRAFLVNVLPERQKSHLKNVRFARVSIVEQS